MIVKLIFINAWALFNFALISLLFFLRKYFFCHFY